VQRHCTGGGSNVYCNVESPTTSRRGRLSLASRLISASDR
jgi:hypothetical protein